MKNICYSWYVRGLALLLAVLFGTAAIFGWITILFTRELTLYTTPLSEVLREQRTSLQSLYSEEIFLNKENTPDCLKNSNLEYGIIKADDLKDVDLKNTNSYLYSNFKTTKPEHYTVSKCFYEDVMPNPTISLFSSMFYYDHSYMHSESTTSVGEAIQELCYNKDNKLFYFKTAHSAFPVTSINLFSSEINYQLKGTAYYADVYPSRAENLLDTSTYREWDHCYFNGLQFFPNDITICTTDTLPPVCHTTFTSDTIENINYLLEQQISQSPQTTKYAVLYEEPVDYTGKTYWIISNVKEPLDTKSSDLFVSQKKLLTFLYNYRYHVILFTVLFTLLCFAAIIFCCRSTRGNRINDTATLPLRYRMPLILYLAITGTVLSIFAALTGSCLAQIPYVPSSLLPILFSSLIVLIALCVLLGTLILMNLYVRKHAHILWKNTLLWHIWKTIHHGYNVFRKNTSLLLKGGLILGGISLLELLVIGMTDYQIGLEITLWFLFKLIEVPVLVTILLQMNHLQQGSRRLAEGDLDSKLDTSRMFWHFKKHGDYLNQIGDGMSIALEDRLKSERFKTELITNVSHDIKTPLTSIINYVDLLKKEDISEQEIKEYLEVLDRQSSRLKKLIEDLMEASKASTGNLAVNLEQCDINILLTQTLGEFEEKLQNNNLELIIKKADSPICIQADNRHLWRIFDNLMNNICKYAQPGTRVYINQENKNNTVQIIFRNTSRFALNITSEELMERFVRGDSSRNTEGSGLGLSIARNLAELMNGTLDLYVDGDLFKVILTFPEKK